MMKELRSVLLVCSFVVLMTTSAYAENVLQNPSFEQYDEVTLVPDNWHVGEGAVEVMSEESVPAADGLVYAGNLGGEIVEDPQGGDPINNENPPLTGKLYQVVDLSTLDNWENSNWVLLDMAMFYRKVRGTSVQMWVEYLPSDYNASEISWDDPAWSGPDMSKTTYWISGYNQASESYPWRETSRDNIWIPCVRWIRVCLYFNATSKYPTTLGEYFVGMDNVSLEAEVFVPPADDPDNLLLNSGFEDYDGQTLIPSQWILTEGSVTAMWHEKVRPYKGSRFVGNYGGYFSENPDPEGDPIDHPNPPMTGTIVQLVDMSNLEDWENSSYIRFGFSGVFVSYHTGHTLNAVVEYLPESYNDQGISEDDPAWGGEDVCIAANLTPWMYSNGVYWVDFATDQGSMPHVRWVRIRLELDANKHPPYPTDYIGPYMSGVDSICFKAEAVDARNLAKNPSFENHDENYWPDDWYLGAGHVHISFEPIPAYDGILQAGNLGSGEPFTGTLYQVLDLSESPFWNMINPDTGMEQIYEFIQYSLSAYVSNVGGTSVALGMEILPYGYNNTDDIAWNDPVWQARDWQVEDDGQGGLEFLNHGGDAIDLGLLIKDEIVDQEEIWREVSYCGWIPRARWVRLRVEFDATYTGYSLSCVAIDQVGFFSECKEYGPYSNVGNLPEANYWEDPNAPDKAVPGWVGEEGDGVCGGYTGMTKRNYINPAFAGFADDYTNYNPSGQELGHWDDHPENITGRPWTDAGWVGQIISMGDMDLSMLEDYFSDDPSGEYHPGEITAIFNESPIVNGPGHDFAGFENGFIQGWTTAYIFGEIVYAEVSSNGTDFIRMPTHCLTPKWPGAYGCFIAQGVFGLIGKHVNAYGDSWGTPFDLDWIADDPKVLDGTVDLNDIRYVRLVDIPGGGPRDGRGKYTALFYDSHGLPIFDSWVTWGSGGADLDSVCVLNSSAADTDGDHITDFWDNCSETENQKQYDTDQDGYGNMCDCDIDGDSGGDGTVSMADYFVFKEAYGSHGPIRIPGEPGQSDEYIDPSENWNADADFNGDNYVTMSDYFIFKNRFGSSAPFK